MAPLAATLTDSASFMVLKSASVTTIGEDRFFERAAWLTAEGFSPDEVAEPREMQVLYQAFIRTGQGFEQFGAAWQYNAGKRWISRVYRGYALLDREHRYHQWYAGVQEFDPLPYLGDLPIPVLRPFGDPQHDQLAPVAAGVEKVEALQQQGKDYTVHVFPGTDHNVVLIDDPDAFPPCVEPLIQWLQRFK